MSNLQSLLVTTVGRSFRGDYSDLGQQYYELFAGI